MGHVMTRLVGLIGHRLGHSVSPLFQQAAFDHLGLDIRYEVWETEQEHLARAIEALRQPPKLGANVTVPYKEAVLPLLEEIDRDAHRIGAVNTIACHEGRLTGYNTDGSGFLRALYQDGGLAPRGKRAVVLGAGGAARAVAFTLLDAGVQSLAVVNRTPERGEALASDLKACEAEAMALHRGDERVEKVIAECDLLVNCTSVGLEGSVTEGESPLEASLIPRRALVYDVIYNPIETPLLKAAKAAGARTLGGLPMLIYQGAAAFELWTGLRAPVDIMLETARRALEPSE